MYHVFTANVQPIYIHRYVPCTYSVHVPHMYSACTAFVPGTYTSVQYFSYNKYFFMYHKCTAYVLHVHRVCTAYIYIYTSIYSNIYQKQLTLKHTNHIKLEKIQCTTCSVRSALHAVEKTVYRMQCKLCTEYSFSNFFKVLQIFSQKTPDLFGPLEPSPKFRSKYILLNFSFYQVLSEFLKVFFSSEPSPKFQG